jgi:hypothetical protein
VADEPAAAMGLCASANCQQLSPDKAEAAANLQSVRTLALSPNPMLRQTNLTVFGGNMWWS